MNKKGLNEIISLVLFILLILSLIAVLYYFISPSVSQGGKQLDPTAACLKARIEPVQCTYARCDVFSTETSMWFAVKLKRNAANVNISDIRYVVTGASGESFTRDHRKQSNPLIQVPPLPNPNENMIKGFDIAPLPEGFVPKTLTITPIIGTGSDKVVCDPIVEPIPCTPASNPAGRCANCDHSSVTPELNANDFQCFINEFAATSPYADFNEDGVYDWKDFMGFCIAYDSRDCSTCPPVTHPQSLTCN